MYFMQLSFDCKLLLYIQLLVKSSNDKSSSGGPFEPESLINLLHFFFISY